MCRLLDALSVLLRLLLNESCLRFNLEILGFSSFGRLLKKALKILFRKRSICLALMSCQEFRDVLMSLGKVSESTVS